jgi:hypothetical protein
MFNRTMKCSIMKYFRLSFANNNIIENNKYVDIVKLLR